MFFDGFDDVFDTVTDVALDLAPTVLPAAAAFTATKLFGGTSEEAWLAAGVAGGTGMAARALKSQMEDSSARGPMEAGSMKPGASSAAGGGGALEKGGVTKGAISGGGTPAATQQQSLMQRMGITGSDLLQIGGTVLESLDTTDDDFRERELDLRTVQPASWAPGSPGMQAVINRSAGAQGGRPLSLMRR